MVAYPPLNNYNHHEPFPPFIFLSKMENTAGLHVPLPYGVSADAGDFGFQYPPCLNNNQSLPVHISPPIEHSPPPVVATVAATQGPEDGYHERIRVVSPLAKPAVGFDSASRRSSLAVKDTPLAKYTAMTFWYLWHCDFSRRSTTIPTSIPPSPLHGSPLAFLDEIPAEVASIRNDRWEPLPVFGDFVAHVLNSTQVSHSVVVLALIYTHRYKHAIANSISTESEPQPTQAFVTALMLANKYLDDNTYTNATWATFLAMPVVGVNSYELRWLDVFDFNLNVSVEMFAYWTSMLDAHITNQQCKEEIYLRSLQLKPFYTRTPLRSQIDQHLLFTRSSSHRARSVSPPTTIVPSHVNLRPSTPVDPVYPRKRKANDAFADQSETILPYDRGRSSHQTTLSTARTLPPVSKGARICSTNTVYTPTLTVGDYYLQTPPDIQAPVFSSRYDTSSLLRPIARMPHGNRRGSTGHVYGANPLTVIEPELRYTAINHNALAAHAQPSFHHTGSALSPARLYFLQAAASPWNRQTQTGHFRKAIPHYFDRYPIQPTTSVDVPSSSWTMPPPAASVPSASTSVRSTSPEFSLPVPISLGGFGVTSPVTSISMRGTPILESYHSPSTAVIASSSTVPMSTTTPQAYAEQQCQIQQRQWEHLHPQPAPFANAGPPGYTYGQPYIWNRQSIGLDGRMGGYRDIYPQWQQHQEQKQQQEQSQHVAYPMPSSTENVESSLAGIAAHASTHRQDAAFAWCPCKDCGLDSMLNGSTTSRTLYNGRGPSQDHYNPRWIDC